MKSVLNIPDGWKIFQLFELGQFSKGSGIVKADLTDVGGVPCIRYAEIYTKYDFVIYECISHIPISIALKAKKIKKGDILFAASGETKKDIGKCVVYYNDISAYAGGDNIIYTLKDNNPIYLSYYLNVIARKQLSRLGQGDSIVHINYNDLKKIKVLIPPLAEQEKIGEILSCWDKGIEKIDSIIKLKERQKKGLMQKLLTGKHRLKGFSSPWNEVKLGDVSDITKGTQLNKLDMIDIASIPVFNGGISLSGYTNSYNRYKNTIIISEGGNSCGFVNFIKTNFWAGGHCYTIDKLYDVDLMFIYYALKFIEKNIMHLRVGSGLPNIQFKSLIRLKLYIPTDIKEQEAIANILQSADKEIDLLQKKLDYLKKQKSGLMQVLLSGKIRVRV